MSPVVVDWSRLSFQLSAAGFGHLQCMQQQQGQEQVPQLTDLYDNLTKVCVVWCGVVDRVTGLHRGSSS